MATRLLVLASNARSFGWVCAFLAPCALALLPAAAIRAQSARADSARALLDSGRAAARGDAKDIRNAIALWREAGESYRRLHEPEGEAIAYNEIGVAFDRLGEADSALAALRHSLALNEH